AVACYGCGVVAPELPIGVGVRNRYAKARVAYETPTKRGGSAQGVLPECCRHGGTARNAADGAAATGTGPAQEDVGVSGLGAPRADLGVGLGERPLQVAVDDVPTRHADRRLDVQRA